MLVLEGAIQLGYRQARGNDILVASCLSAFCSTVGEKKKNVFEVLVKLSC